MDNDCKTPETTVQNVPLARIIYDPGLQMRDHIDGDHVDALCDAIDAGESLPPIDVFDDDEIDPEIIPRYLIGDGNHRFLAAQKRGLKEIACRVFMGGRKAAQKRALGANAEHNALRRTNADKRKSVLCALKLYPKASLRELADICKVTNPFVLKLKKEVLTVSTPRKGSIRTSDPRQMDWYEDFIAKNYKPFETSFLDVVNAPYWMVPDVPPTAKLDTCKQLKDALRKQLHEIEKREDQIKSEILAAKALPKPEVLLGAGKEQA